MLGSSLDAGLCYACLALLCLSPLWSWRGLRTLAAQAGWPLAGLALVALVVRVLAPPAIIHPGFHGYSLLDSILAWPRIAIYKPEYGHATFITLGIACRLLGAVGAGLDGLRETALTNAVFGTGLLVAAAFVALRAGGRVAALATISAGALLPAFVRTAASEDAHTVSCFYGMVALVAADAARRDGFTFTRVMVATAGGLLAFYGRQSLFFWPLLLVLVACAGRFRELASRRATWAVLGLVLLAMVPKVLVLLRGPDETYGLLARLTLPLLPPSIAHHPLFRPSESAALLVMLAGAIPVLVRRRDQTLVVMAGAALVAFGSSIAMSAQPNDGLQYGFRLPLYCILLPIAGAGAAWWFDRLRERPAAVPARALAAAIVLVVGVCPAVALARVLGQTQPLAREYELIAKGAAALPKGATSDVTTVLGPYWELKVPQSAFPDGVRVVESAQPTAVRTRFVYQGLGCFCYPMKELIDPSGPRFSQRASGLTGPEVRGFIRALWDDPFEAMRIVGGSPPAHELRPECEAAFRNAVRFIPWGEIDTGREQPLDRYLTRSLVTVGVWVLPGDDGRSTNSR
jgi:hypothetical protein